MGLEEYVPRTKWRGGVGGVRAPARAWDEFPASVGYPPEVGAGHGPGGVWVRLA
ncbi:hypothetical protein GCM10022226_35310 [Sphaerisporangium flaviroseum]|uniref:Uncharacterized protein n=1 Tax=Sphaerisporangium flaviroseum TaxID=509199 RepID=A0ABP7I7S7_9ACTN